MLLACLQGSIIIGLLFVTFVAWIPNHAASYLGSESDIAGKAPLAWLQTASLHADATFLQSEHHCIRTVAGVDVMATMGHPTANCAHDIDSCYSAHAVVLILQTHDSSMHANDLDSCNTTAAQCHASAESCCCPNNQGLF